MPAADRSKEFGASTLLSLADLPRSIDRLAPHDIRLIGGLGVATLRERLNAEPPSRRPVFFLDLAGGAVESLCQSAITQVTRAVDGLWPFAWGGEEFTAARHDALTLAHLPIRLATLAERVEGLSQVWARSTVEARLRSHSARVMTNAELEWEQVCLMLSPTGLVVVVLWDAASPPDTFIRALEWLAARAPVAIVVLADALPPLSSPWTRLLFGAWTLQSETRQPRAGNTIADRPPGGTAVLLVSPDVEGRPHPLSAVELRLFQPIQADPCLRPLFAFNVVVDDLPLLHAKVDLLWRGGRVAVEVDGAEHRATARYRADRDRDYRLMCAGYRVLRLTNEEVVEDCGRAVAKIRDVVRIAERGRE